MPTTLAEMKGQVYRLLMKTAAYPGFYQPETVQDAIQEAMDFVAADMFIANEGWQTKIKYITTEAGQLCVPIPEGCAMIQQVRYKFATYYQPMVYDDGSNATQYSNDSGVRQWAYQYRIVDNDLYFNPPMAEGGTDYIQLEYMGYPKRLQSDNDFMESHFDFSMQHFIKYKAASILAASLEKPVIPWAVQEAQWYDKMLAIVVKRNLQATQIKEFG